MKIIICNDCDHKYNLYARCQPAYEGYTYKNLNKDYSEDTPNQDVLILKPSNGRDLCRLHRMELIETILNKNGFEITIKLKE